MDGESGEAEKASSLEASCALLEQRHVHDVYEKTAHHFRDKNYKAWPKVKQFLKSLESGSLVADIGCGTGRYMNINGNSFKLGSDHCCHLVEIARDRGHEVMVCDNLRLPYRNNSFDAVISIAVIHHLTTPERRLVAVQELARILRPGGKLMIYVWAMEQKHRKFKSQDVLVPWHMKTKHQQQREKTKLKIEMERSSTNSISEDEGDSTRTSHRHQPVQGQRLTGSHLKMHTESPPPSESTDSGFDNSPKSNRETTVTNTSDRSTEESVDEKVNGNDVTSVTCDKNETNGVAVPSGGPSHRRAGIPSRLRQHFRSLFKGRVTLQEEGEIGIAPKDIAYKKLMHKIMQEQGNSFPFHPHVLEHSLSDPSIEGFAVREFPQSSRTRFASTDHAPRRSDSCSLPAGCYKSRMHAFLAEGESETDIFVAHGESETNVFLGQGESETDVLLAQDDSETITSMAQGESETNTFVAQGETETNASMAQGESETNTSMAQGESETNTSMAQGESETNIFVAQNESEADGDGINVKIHQSEENHNCDDNNQINISRTYQKDSDQYQDDGSALSVVNSLSDIKTATVFHGRWNGNGVCDGSDVETGDQTIYGEQNCSDDVFDTPDIVLEHDIAQGKCDENGDSLSQDESTHRLCGSYHDDTTIQTILSTAQTLAVTQHSVLMSAPASPHSTGSSWGDSSDMSCGGDLSCVGDNDDAIGNAGNIPIATDTSEDYTVGCQDDVTESVTNDIGMSQVDVSNGVINSDDGIGSDDDSIRVSNEQDTIAGDVNDGDRTTGVLGRHTSLVRCDSQPSDDNEWARTTEQAIEAIQTQVLKGVGNLPGVYRGNHQVVLKGVSHHQLNGNRIANSRLSSTSSDIYSESSTDDDAGDSFLNTVTSARTADNPTDDDVQGAVDNGRDHPLDGADTSDTFKRFYHVFCEGELGQLIENHVDCLDVLSAYYDHANWCVIAEKVQVWKI